MKKIFLVLLAVVLILGGIYFFRLNSQFHPYTIQGHTYHLLEARNEKEWEQGLMNKKNLIGGDGMIFLFPDKQIRSFWNKNTYMDLEILWIRDDKVVGKSFLPSIEKSKRIVSVTSPPGVNKAVELIK